MIDLDPTPATPPRNDLVNDVRLVAERLIEFLERENAALQDNDIAHLRATVDEKNRLSVGYGRLFRKLTADRALLDGLSDDERARLRETAARLDARLDLNGQLLEVKIKAGQIVADMIAEAARMSRPGPGTYDKTGEVGRPDPRARNRTPLTVDRSF